MSTAVMSTPMFECSEHLFKNTGPQSKTKDPIAPSHTATGGHAPLRRTYTTLVSTLIEQHRKLDRSVSEPTSRYKTELCRPFEESGSCKYGDKCQFAHGYSELRNLTRHPKYKTELCRTFHTIGFCPYGPRCHFIHNFEEARIHNQKVSAQLGSAQPNILGLSPILNVSAAAAAAAAANLNVSTISLLEQIATSPAVQSAQGLPSAAAAVVAANTQTPLMRTNSLSISSTQHTAAFTGNNTPLFRTTSLNLPSAAAAHHHHHHHQQHHQNQHNHLHIHQSHHQTNSVIGAARPKPLNLSPTFSLGSNAESVSPSSSLSQSPTNSMVSFFSDDCGNNNPASTAFSFGQDFGLLAATRHSPSPPSISSSSANQITDDLIIPRTPSPQSPNTESRLPVFNRISSIIGDIDNLKL